jgi:hypothetical protein
MDLVSVFCRQIPFFPAIFVKQPVFSPLYVFGNSVKNKVGIAAWINFQILYCVPLVFISV